MRKRSSTVPKPRRMTLKQRIAKSSVSAVRAAYTQPKNRADFSPSLDAPSVRRSWFQRACSRALARAAAVVHFFL